MIHVPANAFSPAHIHRVGAWLAASRGDHESERRQLERLIVADPADLEALDRLARLTGPAQRSQRTIDLAARRSEIRTLRNRYEKLFDRNQPIRDAEEMAQIATQLGRTFEARAFLTMEISEDPERADLRRDLLQLPRPSAPLLSHAQNLAEVVAHELAREE